jgi:hypothetical protein
MLYIMWLRFYPCYHNHAFIFNVSVATVHDEINRCIMIIKRVLEHCVQDECLARDHGVAESSQVKCAAAS